ncbi:MAG: hypothetical protein Q8R43_02035 [Alphaproteobacteria bacterium]|nr:hypothetical protein [Alphaproteobacteria bacterium]
MKKYIALLGSASVLSAVCGAEQPLPLNDMVAGMQIADYSSAEEYATHQKTSERFFRRQTKNATARTLIRKFREQYEAQSDYTSIPLDGLSSRTRVLLFREITASLRGVSTTVPFEFDGKKFKIAITPSLRQPGSGIVSSIGKYADVVNVLDIYKNSYQAKIAEKLSDARKKPAAHEPYALDYHKKIRKPILSLDREEGVAQDYKEKLDLEMLNILLDFEVARRLQGTKEQEEQSYYAQSIKQGGRFTKFTDNLDAAYKVLKESACESDEVKNAKCGIQRKIDYINGDREALDSVPVASAVVGLLKLSQQDEANPLQQFFHAPNQDAAGYSWGEYSAFEGAPSSGRRAQATKRIIRKMRGGENAQNSTREQVHQEYLKNFGGASESDGSDYNA